MDLRGGGNNEKGTTIRKKEFRYSAIISRILKDVSSSFLTTGYSNQLLSKYSHDIPWQSELKLTMR